MMSSEGRKGVIKERLLYKEQLFSEIEVNFVFGNISILLYVTVNLI
jgi:hypothetical protein